MPISYLVVAAVVAVAAAVRSTWSPCGLSMLSSITPVAEAGRGHRYGVTAAWFVAGAVAGGATLGGLAAGAAGLVGLLELGHVPLAAIAATACLLAAWCDAGVLGRKPPFLHRQVDETWLRGFRAWVYGSGFGWQIGAGVTTYIMTAGVLATIALAALTGSPLEAFGVCVLFGTVRGLAVLLSANAVTPAAVAGLHRRLDRLEVPVRNLVIVVLCAASAGLAAVAWGPVAAVAVALVSVVPVALTSQMVTRRTPS